MQSDHIHSSLGASARRLPSRSALTRSALTRSSSFHSASDDEVYVLDKSYVPTKRIGDYPTFGSFDTDEELHTPEDTRPPWKRFLHRYGNTIQGATLAVLFVLAIIPFAAKLDPEDSDPVYNYVAVSAAQPLMYELGENEDLARLTIHVWIDRQTHGVLPPNIPPPEYHNPGSFSNDEEIITFNLFKQVALDDWVDMQEQTASLGDLRSVTTIRSRKLSDLYARFEFNLESGEEAGSIGWGLGIRTNSTWPVAMRLVPDLAGPIVRYEVAIAAAILILVYTLIITEALHRTVVALAGSFIALAVMSAIHERPGFDEVVGWIDYETVALLFAMMILVGIFSETGFFEYAAVKAYKYTKGKVWTLMASMCIFTGVMALILDSVTTILLVVPVTIRLCKVIDVDDPVPLILGEVIFANLIGAATPVGDPPNVLIVNYPTIRDQVDFVSFFIHMIPGVIFTSIVMLFVLKRGMLNPNRCKHANPLHEEIMIWRRALARMGPPITAEEYAVRCSLVDHISQLEADLADPQAALMRQREEMGYEDLETPKKGDNVDDDDWTGLTVEELEAKYAIRDMPLFIKSVIVLVAVMLGFFLHSLLPLHMGLTWIAVIGAVTLLVVTGFPVEHVLEKVEFPTLFFFAGLFVLMKSLEEMNLMEYIAQTSAELVELFPEGRLRLAAACLMLLWTGSVAGACIDNIPFTQTMLPVVLELQHLNLPLIPLIYSLVFGICIGGYGTLIGSSANLVAAGLAEQMGYPISFNLFLRKCFPLMILSVVCASIYILLTHVLIPWGH